MNPRVLSEAEEELANAIFYYEDRRTNLGAEFYAQVTDTIQSIGSSPNRFPIYEGQHSKRELRRAKVARFPYIVVYEVHAEETLILEVAHTSREPGYWNQRND